MNITVPRYFVIGSDGSMVDGPYRGRKPALKAMLDAPGYRQIPSWFHVEQQPCEIWREHEGGPRGAGRRLNGWMRERDELKSEWEGAGCPSNEICR